MPRVLRCAAVLFDCDGVLVDSDAAVHTAWTRWAREQRLDPGQVAASVHGRRSADTVAALLPADRVHEALALIDRYELEDAAGVTAIPGAADLLSAVPRWAVVTSGRRELAVARLRAAGLPVPDVLITADDVRNGKPDPEGYATAARRLGVAGSATVVVEDAPAGIAAGRAAGAGGVVGVGKRSAEAAPDVVVTDLRELSWTDGGLLVSPPASTTR